MFDGIDWVMLASKGQFHQTAFLTRYRAMHPPIPLYGPIIFSGASTHRKYEIYECTESYT